MGGEGEGEGLSLAWIPNINLAYYLMYFFIMLIRNIRNIK